jgi:hypothetical protein
VKGLPSASITDDAASIFPQLELCRILSQRIPLLLRKARFSVSYRIRGGTVISRSDLPRYTIGTPKPTTHSPSSPQSPRPGDNMEPKLLP